MTHATWQQQGPFWLLVPKHGREHGLIEFIGGSYLAATPQLSYRRLLESLAIHGWRVHAWSYVPGFDHQQQATECWHGFRRLRENRMNLFNTDDQRRSTKEPNRPLRIGHSLGCKLHLLAPDAGRQACGFVSLAFNNFSAERSIPLLSEMGQQFGFRSEFSPSPEETLRIISQTWRQPHNRLYRFRRDQLDQSQALQRALNDRLGDSSTCVELPGDHLTPASAGLRKNLLGSWADDPAKQRSIDVIADQIHQWAFTLKTT